MFVNFDPVKYPDAFKSGQLYGLRTEVEGKDILLSWEKVVSESLYLEALNNPLPFAVKLA